MRSGYSPQALVGIALLLLYNFISAGQDVYLGDLFQHQHENPIVVLVFSFSFTALFFLALHINSFGKLIGIVRRHPKTIFLVNFSTMLAWFGFFLSVKYLEPAVASAICFGLGPIINCVFWKQIRPDRPLSRSEVLSSLGIFAGLLVLTFSTLSGHSGVGQISLFDSALGILYGTMSSIGIVLAAEYMKRLSDEKVTPKTIMALRFFLLIFLGLILWPSGPSTQMPFNQFLVLMVPVSLLTVIAPLYTFQHALQRSEPITCIIFVCLVPVFTFILQLFVSQFTASWITLAGVVMSVVASAFAAYAGIKKQNTDSEKIKKQQNLKAGRTKGIKTTLATS